MKSVQVQKWELPYSTHACLPACLPGRALIPRLEGKKFGIGCGISALLSAGNAKCGKVERRQSSIIIETIEIIIIIVVVVFGVSS